MRRWTVGGALLPGPDGLLLVANRRRNGSVDWSTPGGVIDDGEGMIDGLTREVAEETGLRVTRWSGPVYEVEAVAEGLGWHLRVEAHLAVEFDGDLCLADPDGIVFDACYVRPELCGDHLRGAPQWVREPLTAWVTEQWDLPRHFRYRIEGSDHGRLNVIRVDDVGAA